jgi:hypothetical protein
VLGPYFWSEEPFAIHHAAVQTLDEVAWQAAFNASSVVVVLDRASWYREDLAQCALLRCIFGNPFRPAAVDSAWLTPGVVELARAIYDDRAFERMPILADALEEAGCTNADILTHCRLPGPHVRGCWVVDLVLGKE